MIGSSRVMCKPYQNHKPKHKQIQQPGLSGAPERNVKWHLLSRQYSPTFAHGGGLRFCFEKIVTQF
jgi:hypothetical protein